MPPKANKRKQYDENNVIEAVAEIKNKNMSYRAKFKYTSWRILNSGPRSSVWMVDVLPNSECGAEDFYRVL